MLRVFNHWLAVRLPARLRAAANRLEARDFCDPAFDVSAFAAGVLAGAPDWRERWFSNRTHKGYWSPSRDAIVRVAPIEVYAPALRLRGNEGAGIVSALERNMSTPFIAPGLDVDALVSRIESGPNDWRGSPENVLSASRQIRILLFGQDNVVVYEGGRLVISKGEAGNRVMRAYYAQVPQRAHAST